MKKRLAVVFAAAAAVSGLGLAGAITPAQAHGGACVATGTVTITTEPLSVAGTNDKPFSFTAGGTCVNGGSWSAAGNGFGGCGASSGTATVTINGAVHSNVTFQTAATTITVTGGTNGGVHGSGNVVADPAEPNNSCTNKTAHKFLLNGTFVAGP